jgi:tetratricopeptide (TPR) repeat protein
MSRWFFALVCLACVAFAETPQKQDQKKEPAKQEEEQVPAEEDQGSAAKVYSFNPLQAQKEVKVGNYYFKKGSYRSAAQRFQEATKWNPNYAEAWLRLGEAAEKQNDEKTAVQAFTRYLELQPDAKEAPQIKKKLEKMKHS